MFFDMLQNECCKKGIKVTPLLVDLNLSTGNISKWKKGALPNGEILIKLADYLDCSIDYLLGRNDEKNMPSDVHTSEFTSMYAKLDNIDQAEIRGEIKQMLKAEKYKAKEEYKNA